MSETELAIFGGGCFWGMEKWFRKLHPELMNVETGYEGGSTDSPTYQQVCTGKTGHAEVIQVTYNPKKTQYNDLVKLFFQVHDATTLNRQGGDVGTQYRSAIFYTSDEQKKVAEEVREWVQANKVKEPIVTEIVPHTTFFRAEDYHQDYLTANPGGYCNHKLRW